MNKRSYKNSKVISFDYEIVAKDSKQKLNFETEIKLSNKKRKNLKNKHSSENFNLGGGEVLKTKNPKKRKNKVNDDESINTNGEATSNQKKLKRKKKVSEESQESEAIASDVNIPDGEVVKMKNPKKRKSEVNDDESVNTNGEATGNQKKEKRKKKVSEESQESGATASDINIPDAEKPLSIRAMKKQKYAKLLEEKKRKSELHLQQKCLSYLSLWKHNREEWRFKKLLQIWLQQNMFETSKIPIEFWDILIEYFSNCRGKVRDIIIKEAIKIIEDDQISEEQEEITVKLKRARDIVQHLQE